MDYLKKYENKPVRKFQEGGPVGGGGADIEGMVMAAYESQDPNMALQAINAIAEAMMGAAQASQGGAAAPAPEAVPAAKNGMKVEKGVRTGSATPLFKEGGLLA